MRKLLIIPLLFCVSLYAQDPFVNTTTKISKGISGSKDRAQINETIEKGNVLVDTAEAIRTDVNTNITSTTTNDTRIDEISDSVITNIAAIVAVDTRTDELSDSVIINLDSITAHNIRINNNVDSLVLHLDTLQAHDTRINTNLTTNNVQGDTLTSHNTRINTNLTTNNTQGDSLTAHDTRFISLENDTAFIAVNWGVIPDDAVDDRAAIIAMFTAAQTAGGGRIKFPAGTITISDSIVVPDSCIIEGVSMAGTIINCSGSDRTMFAFTGQKNTTIRYMTLRADGQSGVNGVRFTTTESDGTYFNDINFYNLHNGIKVEDYWTHCQITRCEFWFNEAASVLINDGTQINSIEFDACRFEQTDSSHYRAIGTVNAHSGVTFNKCIFESTSAQKAVDLGDNAKLYVFESSHFENNGIGQGTAYDIYIAGGSENVDAHNCTFSGMASGVTAGYSIYFDTGARNAVVWSNKFTSTDAGYVAITTNIGTRNIVLMANTYPADHSVGYLDLDGRTIRIADGSIGGPIGGALNGSHGYVQTTNASVTNLWDWSYIPSNTMFYLIADVVATEDDGSEYASYTRKALIKHTTGNTITLIGQLDDATIESTAAWDCNIAVAAASDGTIEIEVTGEVGKNIKWVADVKIVSKTWTN
ncbi:MAG: hypothetical protein KAS32_20670 [Candidatus Peribacteraceae bacterium]|nr:hypothetical protein [Candidatus Peribacteraceae bacterium]